MSRGWFLACLNHSWLMDRPERTASIVLAYVVTNGERLTAAGCEPLAALQLQAVRTEDQLVHVQWVDRTSGALVEDLIVFPEEAKLEEMPMPRCYVLKFQQGAGGRSVAPSAKACIRIYACHTSFSWNLYMSAVM